MRWHNQLYVGKKAKKKRKYIIEHIRYEKFQPGAYVITPAESGNNILDIYPAAELLLPAFRAMDLLIVGIAANYWEALEVAAQIVDEMYQKTGGFDLDRFLGLKGKKGLSGPGGPLGNSEGMSALRQDGQ